MKSTSFLCAECGETFPQWYGKCLNCKAFGTIKEFREKKHDALSSKSNIDLTTAKNTPSIERKRIVTHIDEFDRVLGGGFMGGSITLFGGVPGIGKSTLSLQVFLQLYVALEGKVMYFSGEEHVDQILSRAQRLGDKKCITPIIEKASRHIFSTYSIDDIVYTVREQKPKFIVVDSIQMVGREGVGLGSISQIRDNAEALQNLAKSTPTTILVIGHVTKGDEIAGPRILEHVVDSVLYLDGNANSDVRILRGIKNRFGSTLEIGVFTMSKQGLAALTNPSDFFLAERGIDAFGSAISIIREGSRNFMMEIQVLTVKTNFGNPRRTANGSDIAKFHLLLAVVSKYTSFRCEEFDAYLNVIGGLTLKEPSSDLAIIAAILSSRMEKEIPTDIVIFGEVGLSGEIRSVNQLELRLKEIQKMGFKQVITSNLPKNITPPQDIQIHSIAHIRDLLRILFETSEN